MQLHMTLFIAGADTTRSTSAKRRLDDLVGRLRPETVVDVVDVLEDPARAEVAGVFATPTLVVELPPPARRVIGDLVDPDHLEAALLNLLTNAEKYGAAPYCVRARGLDGVVELRVVDHGAGVPPGFRGRMFERFSRDRGVSRDKRGTGLGLPIVRGLLQRNGGTIGYEPTEGGGATFVLTLPTP